MRQSRTWLLGFVLLGLSASLASLYVQYRLLLDPAYSSFCHVSRVFDCDVVYQSRFGTFHGVPVALGGVVWFTLALLLTLVKTSGSTNASATTGYLFAISIPAVSVVLFLAFTSFAVLKAVCILCVMTYVAVAGVFVNCGASAHEPFAQWPRQFVRDVRALAARPLALGVAVFFLGSAIAAVGFFQRLGADPTAALAAVAEHQPTDFDLWFEEQVREPAMMPKDGTAVMVVKFTDDQCTGCAQTYTAEREILAKYQAAHPGQVSLIVKLVNDDIDLAHRLGVKATPTFFINGVRLDGAVNPQFLDQAIAHELRVTARAKRGTIDKH